MKKINNSIKNLYKKKSFWVCEEAIIIFALIALITGNALHDSTYFKLGGEIIVFISVCIIVITSVVTAIYFFRGFIKTVKSGYKSMHNYTGYDNEQIFSSIDKYKLIFTSL